jgi:hypothetical protein
MNIGGSFQRLIVMFHESVVSSSDPICSPERVARDDAVPDSSGSCKLRSIP